MSDEPTDGAPAVHKTITVTTEHDAVLWDGRPESWAAIYALPWDDCYLRGDRPGVVCSYGMADRVPLGAWVYTDTMGHVVWDAPGEVVEP